MRRSRLAWCGLALCLPWLLACAHGGEDVLRKDVAYLSSQDLGGRLTGTEGERRAATYLAGRLRALGARPLPGQESFLVPFDFTAGSVDAGSRVSLAGGPIWEEPQDVRALAFSDSTGVSGPVVFAGYGLTLPEAQDFSYDSYAGLDVENKIVLVLRYFPEDAAPDARAKLARYAGLRYKALQARERGAKALLVATGPRSPRAGETVPMSFDTAISGSGIVAASVGGRVAEALFTKAGRSLAAVQAELDTGNPHVAGFPMPGVDLQVEVALRREQRRGRNVIGLLPGKEPALERPFVILGAHYDHLGRGSHGNSLARGDERDEIHPGADDNASGVAAVLSAARQLAAMELRRNVVLAFWSGEELGLLGSTRFLEESPLGQDQLAAYLNLDMVGRSRNNRLLVQAVGSSEGWPEILEQANLPVGFDLELQSDPQLPTDSLAFDRAGIPTLTFFTGSHEDYHRPTDTAARLDYPALARVAELTARTAARIAAADEAPRFVRVPRSRGTGMGRDSLRAYTGTIPDYTSDANGLSLGGVVEGGPAQVAGLRDGDVIVEFGGQTIANIYDYTYALEAAKIGEPVRVIYLRGGERAETQLTPLVRP